MNERHWLLKFECALGEFSRPEAAELTECELTRTKIGAALDPFCYDGHLDVSESSVDIAREDFGAEVDHRDRDSRLDRPAASQFGVDDQPDVEQSAESAQSTLFAATADDQQTLAGDNANTRCLYEDRSYVELRKAPRTRQSMVVSTDSPARFNDRMRPKV